MADNSTLRLFLTVGLLLTAFIIRRAFKLRTSLGEPPIVPASLPIPYLGHAVGLFWQRTGYYTNLSNKWKLPIFSLRMFGGEVHVVSSPELMHALHKLPKSISFWFLEAQFSAQLSGISQKSSSNLLANLSPESNEASLLIEGLKATQHAMSAQGGVEDTVFAAAQVIKRRLDALCDGGRNVNLWAWTQHEITLATTESVYGPSNPYRDAKVEEGFWNFADDTISLLLTQYLPKIIAARALAGREAVVTAMNDYFASKGHLYGSSLVKARYLALKEHVDDVDLARLECVNGIAILSNTVPTAFWTIYHIFGDPAVLHEVRRQVGAITTQMTPTAGLPKSLQGNESVPVCKIDLGRLKEAPILFSVIQETLRLRATGSGPRMVMEDVRVGSQQYLLKKHSVVIIANKALHSDRVAWGETANADPSKFIADRFCGRTPPHAFRGFGGGINLCPGRGFAMAEIAALVAMLTMRFDLVPTKSALGGDSGGWIEPDQNLSNMSLQIAPPKRKVVVDIVPRLDSENVSWEFIL
ncbi:cytochrome P450 [Tricladium varicosporioides]|nr:cytochrome P450 [Hymenoscyphus varicosporioides]